MSSCRDGRRKPRSGGPLRAAAILTMALAAGCGKGEDAAPPETGPAASVAADSPPAPVPDATPVALPTDFPAELPLPPGATVVQAETTADETGTADSAVLVTSADADDTLSWYARALADAGWQVVEHDERSVHAVQGESYADVTVTAAVPDRTRLEARMWRAGR